MKQLIFPMKEQYEEYLTDESKFTGKADSISFPENEEEIQEVLKELRKEKIPVTIQGGKTGITGGSVPMGGNIMNLSRMNRVTDSELLADGTGLITVEPGLNLMDLKQEISRLFRKNPLFWPPDPTETSASVGGIAAADAQGITGMLYGGTSSYIEKLHLIDYEGKIRKIKKGEKITRADGTKLEWIEAVLGKEGITGIISRLTLRLIPKPESVWGIGFFFEEEKKSSEFADFLRDNLPSSEDAAIAAVEYIDRMTIDLIEKRKSTMTKIRELPDVAETVNGMIYVEIHGKEEGIESVAEELMEAAMEYGSDPDTAWAVSGETDTEKMHAFRHGAAETVNLFIEEARRNDSRITKLGTDMSIDGMKFSQVVTGCRRELLKAGLNGCIFGHVMGNHLHVNLLPANYEEYKAGIKLLQKWAQYTAKNGGKVIGEHGIGKLKQQIIGSSIPGPYIEKCQKLKQEFDKENRINPGNIFPEKAGDV